MLLTYPEARPVACVVSANTIDPEMYPDPFTSKVCGGVITWGVMKFDSMINDEYRARRLPNSGICSKCNESYSYYGQGERI